MQPVISMAHGQGGAEIAENRSPTLTCNHEAPIAAYGNRTANTSSNGWGIQEEATHTLDGAMGIAAAHTLRGEGFDASEDGTGRGTPLVPVACDVADTLSVGANQTTGFKTDIAAVGMQVRRLTPVECERLQGFPDNYTAIPWRKKPASECPDGPRYRALGNSWAVPVVRWIGKRIEQQ